jgi:hypothetical protein
MIIVAGAGVVLWLTGVTTLFWVEIAVALLFAVFWTVQTIEQLPASAPEPGPGPTAAAPSAATAPS